MAKLTVYTHMAAAVKVSFDVEDATKISFHAVGGGDGVPPGMQIQNNEQVIFWCAAQDFGIAIVEDEKVTVESAPA